MMSTTDMLMGKTAKAQIPALGFPIESFFGSNVAVPAANKTGTAASAPERTRIIVMILIIAAIGYALWHWNYNA